MERLREQAAAGLARAAGVQQRETHEARAAMLAETEQAALADNQCPCLSLCTGHSHGADCVINNCKAMQ